MQTAARMTEKVSHSCIMLHHPELSLTGGPHLLSHMSVLQRR